MSRRANFYGGVTDNALKAQADAGSDDQALHAEVARRGGLDYLNYQRSEWAKSPGDRDESKRIR